jgi:AcrR family transcriptional regulator
MASNKPREKGQNGNALRDRVYVVAAEVFHRKGYDNTSMSDVAEAAGLTKAGLYHHISSKESLLYTILDYGLDLTDSYVVEPLRRISDPVERLKTLIDLHLRLVLEERNLEVTGLLHECRTLSNADKGKINRRKKAYVQMTTDLIAEIAARHNLKSINPKLAAFALLGMLNWTYQWYKTSGPIRCDEIIENFQRIFLHGLLGGESWTESQFSTPR